MPNLEFALLSRSCLTDEHTKALSILEVVEEYRIDTDRALPKTDDGNELIPLSFCIVSLWSKGDDDDSRNWDAAIKIRFPDGTESKNLAKFPIALESADRSRSIVRFGGMIYKGDGDYFFDILLTEGDDMSVVKTLRLPIEVFISKKQETPKETA